MHFLYCLIFKRVSVLYVILQLHPDLIYELTYAYKSWLSNLKTTKSSDPVEQGHLTRLINLCSTYVALICEYYQTIKNTANQAEMAEEQSKTPEKIVLDLLEEVFCASKKELYREIFINPEMYLERLYLPEPVARELTCAIDVFKMQAGSPPALNEHAVRKASLSQQELMEAEE
jgi:hypothetical protein